MLSMNRIQGLFRISPFVRSLSTSFARHSIDNKSSGFSSNYQNRNPRNLEWSGHQFKPFGWNLQYPPRDFYHRCVFKKTNKNLTAELWHHSAGLVISMATSDPEIKQHLFSTRDQSAAVNLARIFADRCIKSGIVQIDYYKDNSFENSKREQQFYNTLVESGLKLEEPAFIDQTNEQPGLDYDAKNFYHQRQQVPFPPEENKRIREKLNELAE